MSLKGRRRGNPMQGICRIDQESTRTHGYVVRLGWHRKRDGTYAPRLKAFFGDASHGGKRRSLAAAQKWQVASLKELSKGKKR